MKQSETDAKETDKPNSTQVSTEQSVDDLFEGIPEAEIFYDDIQQSEV